MKCAMLDVGFGGGKGGWLECSLQKESDASETKQADLPLMV